MSSLLAGLRDAQLLQQVIPVTVQPRRGRLTTGRVVPLRVVAGPVDVARHGGPDPVITYVLLPWADRGRPVPPPGGRPEQARGDEGRCGQARRGFRTSHTLLSSGAQWPSMVGHDRRHVAAAAVSALPAGAEAGLAAGLPSILHQRHRTARAAARGRRTAPHQPKTTPGLGGPGRVRRPDPAAASSTALPSPGHPEYDPALASLPGAREVDLPNRLGTHKFSAPHGASGGVVTARIGRYEPEGHFDYGITGRG
jgi:hypothetical protein